MRTSRKEGGGRRGRRRGTGPFAFIERGVKSAKRAAQAAARGVERGVKSAARYAENKVKVVERAAKAAAKHVERGVKQAAWLAKNLIQTCGGPKRKCWGSHTTSAKLEGACANVEYVGMSSTAECSVLSVVFQMTIGALENSATNVSCLTACVRLSDVFAVCRQLFVCEGYAGTSL